VPAIRYRLTDALLDPAPIAAASYTEQLVRLPRVFCCFQPPANAPPVSPLPAAANGFVTFGSLNNYIKVSEPTLHAWSRVLAAVPDSQLVLQSRIFVDAASCERVRRRFAARGIAPERLHLHGPMPLEAHLRVYDSIDMGLDTLPWNGHTTTCLALHMGVPVVSLAGDVGAARMGLCVLSAADLASWVATREDGYVELARQHAARLDELAQLRAGLRERLATSPLCDAAGLARDVEAAYSALCDQNSSS
jgi:protein O-GlcNAc transferase